MADKPHHIRFRDALLAFVSSGLVGILVDLDHLLFHGISREAHVPSLVVAGILFCYSCTCLGRLFLRVVLSRE